MADGPQNFADTLENSLSVSQMLNTNLQYDPAIPLLDIDSRKMKTCVHINACTHMFIAALIRLVKKWNQFKCQLSDEQINKMWYVYTMEYYLAIQRNSIHICCNKDKT